MTILEKIKSWFTQTHPAPDARRAVGDALSADMCHYSGYVRQAALDRAAELRSLDLLPAIVDRLNDWVPQVRQRA